MYRRVQEQIACESGESGENGQCFAMERGGQWFVEDVSEFNAQKPIKFRKTGQISRKSGRGSLESTVRCGASVDRLAGACVATGNCGKG